MTLDCLGEHRCSPTIDANSYYWINLRDPLYLSPFKKEAFNKKTKTKRIWEF